MKMRVSLEAATLPAATARLGAPGWAGVKSGLFEYPAWCTPVISDVQASAISACPQSFPAACWEHSRWEPGEIPARRSRSGLPFAALPI